MFNSLKYAKKLEEAGVTREQAEAHVQILTEVMETNFATKHDFIVLENAMKHDFEALEGRISAKFEAFESATSAKFDTFEMAISSKFDAFENATNAKFDAFEKTMNGKFDTFDKATGAKLDAFASAVKSEFLIRDERFDSKLAKQETRLLLKGGAIFSVGLSLFGAFLKLA